MGTLRIHCDEVGPLPWPPSVTRRLNEPMAIGRPHRPLLEETVITASKSTCKDTSRIGEQSGSPHGDLQAAKLGVYSGSAWLYSSGVSVLYSMLSIESAGRSSNLPFHSICGHQYRPKGTREIFPLWKNSLGDSLHTRHAEYTVSPNKKAALHTVGQTGFRRSI